MYAVALRTYDVDAASRALHKHVFLRLDGVGVVVGDLDETLGLFFCKNYAAISLKHDIHISCELIVVD